MEGTERFIYLFCLECYLSLPLSLPYETNQLDSELEHGAGWEISFERNVVSASALLCVPMFCDLILILRVNTIMQSSKSFYSRGKRFVFFFKYKLAFGFVCIATKA